MYQNGGKVGGFSHKAPVSATDLRCYFQCTEAFKKDYDLRIHLKIRHRNEDENELRRAYQAAEEEINLVKRSMTLFQCELCQKKYDDVESFSGHVRKVHKTLWPDYLEKYGRCEIQSAPFECKVCGSVVQYSGTRIDRHLKTVHKIKWAEYIDYIRSMQRGEGPKELPKIDYYTCKICNTSVKFIKEHLKTAHKITEMEYMELYPDNSKSNEFEESTTNYQGSEYMSGTSSRNIQSQQNYQPMNYDDGYRQHNAFSSNHDTQDKDINGNHRMQVATNVKLHNVDHQSIKSNSYYGANLLPDQPLPRY